MIIAIDIGGTKTLVAVFDSSMNIVQSVKFKTPLQYSEFLDELKRATSELSLSEFKAGAIGARGIIDRTSGTLVQDSVLAWRNAPLVKDCTELFQCDFSIENDSKLAGLSEARAVDSTVYHKVVYVTISTGIGSTFVIDGTLDQHTINSEVGKWAIEKDGKVQLWENIASGSWITETYGTLASEIDDTDTWKEISHRLALGFINISAAYTPDLIIIGGGVGNHFNKFGDILQKTMNDLAHPMISIPPVIEASYPEDAVIYGCYHHANDALSAS
jgi:predicted NBD/HSP70 family sugar kinase